MAENTKIEWATHTFNPWMGCTKVSEGCKFCYAENQMDRRWNKVQWGPGKPRVRTSPTMWRKPIHWNVEAEKTGLRPRVFSLSLGDWLDPEVPGYWLADFLSIVCATPHLDWLLLTKRPELWGARLTAALDSQANNRGAFRAPVIEFCEKWLNGYTPPNVWLGASVENQEQANKRIWALLKCPAAVRFLSCEPLLGAVNLDRLSISISATSFVMGSCLGNTDGTMFSPRGASGRGIDWVICGGESGVGPGIRPMHPDWAGSLRDQCQAAEVPFFFKQWGGQNKKAAGRMLDGCEWNELPGGRHA